MTSTRVGTFYLLEKNVGWIADTGIAFPIPICTMEYLQLNLMTMQHVLVQEHRIKIILRGWCSLFHHLLLFLDFFDLYSKSRHCPKLTTTRRLNFLPLNSISAVLSLVGQRKFWVQRQNPTGNKLYLFPALTTCG